METTARRSIVRIIATLALLLGMGAAAAITGSAAFADDEYVQQQSSSFDLLDREKNRDPMCRGFVFIGQTASNTIEATGSVTCKPGVKPSIVRSYVGIHTGGPAPIVRESKSCIECGASFSAVSLTNAQPGTRYCALASGNDGINAVEGFGTVCITA